jgi:hypothetical protein
MVRKMGSGLALAAGRVSRGSERLMRECEGLIVFISNNEEIVCIFPNKQINIYHIRTYVFDRFVSGMQW